MATSFKKVTNNGQSALYADVTTTGQTTIQVVPAEAPRFPLTGSFWVRVYNNVLPSSATQSELMLVTGVSSNTFTVTRNADGLGAFTFSTTMAVRENIMAEHVSDLETAVNTIENKLDGTTDPSLVTLKKPTIAAIKGGGTNTNGHTVPNLADDTFALLGATQTLTGKTSTNMTLSGTATTTAGNHGYDATDKAILVGDGAVIQSIYTSAWKSYTPTYSNITVGNGTVTAAYCIIGKTILYRFNFALGSTSSIGSAPTISLPVTLANPTLALFPVTILDNGSAFYAGGARVSSGTTVNLVAFNASGTYTTQADVTSTVPHTWAATDSINFLIQYEAA